MRRMSKIIAVLGILLAVASCSQWGLNAGVIPDAVQFDLHALVNARSIFVSQGSTASRSTGGTAANTLYIVDTSGAVVQLELRDQSGNTWEPLRVVKSGLTTLCLQIGLGEVTKYVLVDRPTGQTTDVSASLAANRVTIGASPLILDDGKGATYFLTDSTPNPAGSTANGSIYKIDMASGTIAQMNNPQYTPICDFIPINGKVIAPGYVIELGKVPIATSTAVLFETAVESTTAILDPKTSIFWRIATCDQAFWTGVSTPGNFRLMSYVLGADNTIQETMREDLGIRGIAFPNPSGVAYSWFDYSQRYLVRTESQGADQGTTTTPNYTDYVIVLSYDPFVGTPTVAKFKLSEQVSDNWPNIAFLGNAYIIHKESDGLYSTNYQSDTSVRVFDNGSILSWSLNGDFVLVTTFVDNVNTKTVKIDADGNIVDANQTDIRPMELVSF